MTGPISSIPTDAEVIEMFYEQEKSYFLCIHMFWASRQLILIKSNNDANPNTQANGM